MSFSKLDFPDYLIQAVEKLNFKAPTAIQEKAIPLIKQGSDVVARAQTGTGKTAAFGFPLIERLVDLPPKKKKISVLGLILVPTRELAIQLDVALKSYAEFTPKALKTTTIIGGEAIDGQKRVLRMGVDIVIATPGRLLDLIELGEIRLVELKMLVLDEADKMLDLGFNDELNELLQLLPKKRQNLLFSATMPPKVVTLANKLLTDAIHVTIESEDATVEAIQQRVIKVNKHQRRPLLYHLIKTEDWKQALIFVSSKRSAHNLCTKLKRDGISAEAFHSDLKQDERAKALRKFKNKDVRILIATDIAARGIDINKLSHVLNYDLPRSPMDYIHRIGRTGRAGQQGMALSFIDQESEAHFKLIEKRAEIKLEREELEGFEYVPEVVVKPKGKAPAKGKRKSKKDKLREQEQKNKGFD